MRENLEELNDAGLADTPGAARRRRAHAHLRRARPARGLRRPRLLRQGRVRGPAHDGHAHGGQAHRRARPRLRPRARRARPAAAARREMRGRPTVDGPRRVPTSRPTSPVFTPPFLGSRVAKGISLDEIAAYINETALFRNQWQFRPDKTLRRERRGVQGADPPDAARAARRRRRPRAGSCPRSLWGYFPVNAEGNDLVVWNDDDRRSERLRFTFPRQRKDRHLCIADFFRPVDVGRGRLRRVPRRHGGRASPASASGSCSPPTGTRTTCCCTACRSR